MDYINLTEGLSYFIGAFMSEEQMLYLFKFGKKIHMEDFRCNGSLYMNTVSFFKNLENQGNIGDENEGLVECFQSHKVDVIFKKPSDQSTIVSTKDGSLTLTGQIRTRDALIDHQNIFCMYTLKYKGVKPIVDERNIEFGDTYVAVTSPDAFLDRIKTAAKKLKQCIQADLVEYVDRKTHHGKMGVFKKFKAYDYQSEYRIALLPGYGAPFKLVIGDISDISIIGNINDLNNSIEIIDKTCPMKN